MYWGLRDRLGEARTWIDQLLPTVDSLDPRAQIELLWASALTDLEVVGDVAAANALFDVLDRFDAGFAIVEPRRPR